MAIPSAGCAMNVVHPLALRRLVKYKLGLRKPRSRVKDRAF